MKLYFVLPILPMDSIRPQLTQTLTPVIRLFESVKDAQEYRRLSTNSSTLKDLIKTMAQRWNNNHTSRKTGYTIEGKNILFEEHKFAISDVIKNAEIYSVEVDAAKLEKQEDNFGYKLKKGNELKLEVKLKNENINNPHVIFPAANPQANKPVQSSEEQIIKQLCEYLSSQQQLLLEEKKSDNSITGREHYDLMVKALLEIEVTLLRYLNKQIDSANVISGIRTGCETLRKVDLRPVTHKPLHEKLATAVEELQHLLLPSAPQAKK